MVLFGCAGTLGYWQGWLYLLLMAGLSTILTVDLMRRDPALLERRLKGEPTAESRPLQRMLMLRASVGYFGLLIVPRSTSATSGPPFHSPRCPLSGDRSGQPS